MRICEWPLAKRETHSIATELAQWAHMSLTANKTKKQHKKTPKGGADSLPENTEIPKLKSKPAGATQLMPRLSQSELPSKPPTFLVKCRITLDFFFSKKITNEVAMGCSGSAPPNHC